MRHKKATFALSAAIISGLAISLCTPMPATAVSQKIIQNVPAASFLSRLKAAGVSTWKDRSGPYQGFGPSPTYLFTTTDPSGLACSVYAYRDPNMMGYDRSAGNFPTDSRPYWWFTDSKTSYSIVVEAGSLKTKCGKAIVKAFNLSS